MSQNKSLQTPLQDEKYTFLFIGKTGTGKSSLCNSISGTNEFVESDSSISVTSEPQSATSTHFCKTVTVVDTPGIMDTSVNSNEAKIKSLEEMYKAISLCPPSGRRAIIIVLKYSDRFTKENETCIYIVEKIFGEECLEKCCIILFTHGDQFDENNKEQVVPLTFEEWCLQQKGALGKLFEKCKKRIVLFRKNDEDKKMNQIQIKSLLELADALDESYTDERFEEAKKKHERLKLESILPERLTHYDQRLNDILVKINENLIEDQTIENFKSYKSEVIDVCDDLALEDKDVYYEQNESSIFEEPKSRAEKMLELIHLQLLRKLKHVLTSTIDKWNYIIRTCKDEKEVNRVDEERKILYESFLEYGLIINQEGITINVDRNDLNLKTEDEEYFKDVINQVKELEESMIEKRNSFISIKTKAELELELKSLQSQLDDILVSDYYPRVPINIKRKARQILEEIQGNESFLELAEQFQELERSADKKVMHYRQRAFGSKFSFEDFGDFVRNTLNENHYTFLFIGKTGTGKSSLCNSISGTNEFVESDSGISVTSEPQSATSTHFCKTVTVVDTPGIMDTSVNSNEAKIKSLEEMYKAISLCPPSGRRAIILVLKYSDRFTKENETCIYIVEKIFGDECLEKCCIILFTHGDQFDENNEEQDVPFTFEEWCLQQKGELGKLFEKCKKRIVLFRKNDEDKEMNQIQIESLLKTADSLDESYTDQKFEDAKRKHERVKLESILPERLTYYEKILIEIQSQLNEIVAQDQSMENLMSYESKTNEMLQELAVEDAKVYYEEGEVSLLEEPKSEAELLLEKIHLQLLRKLKHDLRTAIKNLKYKLRSCKEKKEMDDLEEERKLLFDGFLNYGLVVEEEKITIDLVRNILKLQTKDLEFFNDVINKMEALERSMVQQRKSLTSIETRTELELELKSLTKKLDCISDLDTDPGKPSQIKEKAKLIIKKYQKDNTLEGLTKQFMELVDIAETKRKQCKRNRLNMYLETGAAIITAATGLFGPLMNVGGKIAVRTMPVILYVPRLFVRLLSK
ncbi:GIMAP protein [Biomphalaria glabrata]|nr:GIMAP Resistant factor [Biomphalaria glabrata]